MIALMDSNQSPKRPIAEFDPRPCHYNYRLYNTFSFRTPPLYKADTDVVGFLPKMPVACSIYNLLEHYSLHLTTCTQ
jgi:hypothetical protein